MIVATAGHVDHGKTLLVKKLTGMDTDRLAEEKRRGLSINLGFAYRRSAQHRTVAFVDVPGHMRFINNMIAGINGIDLGMLVVAADDGPMPQTREHMDVLRLLGVKHFALVLSKIDRVNAARLAEVRELAMELFPEPSAVPVFEVNTPAEQGIAALADYLEQQADAQVEISSCGRFRLSIDRAFLIKGSGLVVTGTPAAGNIAAGDSLVLMPANQSVRVRSLQVQEQEQAAASAGQRCALNITGNVSKEDIERGDWLLEPGHAHTSERLDARVSLLPGAAFGLKHMAPVKLYIGAKRLAARLALLQGRNLAPGQSALAQLIVTRPLHCCHGDRFLLRDDSETATLGGGTVLDPFARAQNRSSKQRLKVLESMEQGNATEVLGSLLLEHGLVLNLGEFRLAWNLDAGEEAALLTAVNESGKLKQFESGDQVYLASAERCQAYEEWIMNTLQSLEPGDPGQNAEGFMKPVFRSRFTRQFPGIDPDPLLEELHSAGRIKLGKRVLVVKKAGVELPEAQRALWQQVESHLQTRALQVPVLVDMGKTIGQDLQAVLSVCRVAAKNKWLVMLADNRFILREHLLQLADAVQALADKGKPFSVAEFKNSCGIGRNLAVEVLEYFDKIGFTLRKESGRVVLHRDRINTMSA